MNLWNIKDKVPYRVTIDEWKGSDIVYKDDFNFSVVSTVFLGIDHGFGDDPILFETMVFGGEYDGIQKRYSTWDEAVEGHYKICYLVNKVAIDRDRKLNEIIGDGNT
jgi:hypothetical protein